MSSCRSSSLAILALTTGVTISAWAGDKIEFSAPGIALAPPTVERDTKEIPKMEDFRAPTQPDALVLGDYGPISPDVVIVSRSKKESKAFDLTTRDGRDSDIELDNSDNNQDSARRTTKEPVDQWYDQRADTFEAGNRFSQRRMDAPKGEDNLRSRLEKEDAESRTAYPNDERYGRYGSRDSFGSTDETTESHGFFNHGLNGLDRMQSGQFMSSYEEALAASQQATQVNLQRAPIPRDDSYPDASAPLNGSPYNSQFDSSRDRSIAPTIAPPHTYRSADTTSSGQTADVFAPQDPPASPQGQVQSRPAVLPFPRRPGDVLR